MKKLLPCIVCKRHIRETENTCPFCAATPALVGLALLLGACDTKPAQQNPEPNLPTNNTPTPKEIKEEIQKKLDKPISTSTPTTNNLEEKKEAIEKKLQEPPKVTAPDPTTSLEEQKKAIQKKLHEPRNTPAYGSPGPRYKEPVPLYGSPAIPDYNRWDEE